VNWVDPLGLCIEERNIGGVDVRLQWSGEELTGIGIQLTGDESSSVGDLTVPSNTWMSISYNGTHISISTSNSIGIDGPLFFGGTISSINFNSDGSYVSSNAVGNAFTPNSFIQSAIQNVASSPIVMAAVSAVPSGFSIASMFLK
jgi:hypothetical protein